MSDGRLLHELRGHEAPIFLGRFLPNDRVVTGSDDGTVRVWSLPEGTSTILMRHGGAVSALDVHEERVLAAWEDGSLMVGEPDGHVHELPPHTHNVFAASFDPSGHWWAAVPRERWPQDAGERPDEQPEWDARFGDRFQQLVFIGIDIDEAAIRRALDACLLAPELLGQASAAWLARPNPFPQPLARAS